MSACRPPIPASLSQTMIMTPSFTAAASKTNPVALAPTSPPHPTLSPTVTAIATILQLPDWMHDKNQEILMYRMLTAGNRAPIDEAETVNFLNPDTGEKYTINMPDAFLCWHDNTHAVFVHDPHEGNEPPFLFVLDLSNGQLAQYTENDPIFETYYFYTWMCDPQTGQNPYLPEYDLKVDLIQNEQTTSIINNRTGTIEILTDPKDGIEDIVAAFSPGYKYIAVFQVNDKSNYYAGYFNQISVYEVSNRELLDIIQDNSIRTGGFLYDGNLLFYEQERQTFCIVNIIFHTTNCLKNRNGFYSVDHTFSTDSNYFVLLQGQEKNDPMDGRGDRIIVYDLQNFQEYLSITDNDINNMRFLNDSNSLIYMRGKTTPCIVDLATKTKKCINAIPNRYPDHYIKLNGFRSDGKTLEFLHWGINDDQYSGGLCEYNLLNGAFHCPTDGLEILKRNVVTGYELSPDERYLSFTYEFGTCPICDGGGLNPSLAVIGRDGTHFIDLGLSNSGGPAGTNLVSSWRPLAADQLNP
jgi:hypothetical protein